MQTKHLIFSIVGAAMFGALCSAAMVSYINDGPVIVELENPNLVARVEQLELELGDAQVVAQQLQARLNQTQTGVAAVPQAAQRLEQAISEEQLATTVIESASADVTPLEASLTREQRRALFIDRFQPDFKKRRLVESGFSEDEAQWVIDSEADVQLQQLYDQYNQRRAALEQAAESGQAQNSARAELRTKLGDEVFERYLKANGQSTSITVGGVMASSPGDNAGLQPGDNIVAYDGQRVFDVRDLNQLTIQGTEGESVLLEVERNGNTTQLTIPRGPIGVTAARGRFGRQ
ncbi:MAG: PDZ domain-containing protein [Pseudomonadota bacterium]